MTPTPQGQPENEDRGWLEYDDAAADRAGSAVPFDEANPADGADDVEAAPSPWLRHEAPADTSPPDGASPSGPQRDPAWLAQELDVPAQPGNAHDTGVPPTLAEEPTTVHPSVEPESVEPERAEPQTGEPEGVEPEDEAGLVAVAGAAVKEFAIVVGMALVLSFIVKTWLLQAFYIPSGSMEDTLVLNDRVIVSKLTPGPVDLKRGDIIVFADPGEWLEEAPQVPHGKVVTAIRETATFVGLLPDNSENHLIKRVIGLPGDRVVCCDEGGRITVNGTAIKEPYLKPGDAASDQDFDITVPRGRVWVMGDHRSNSADSRAHDAPEDDGSRGSVDERLIVGRAVALVWPLDHLTWLSNPTETFAKVPAAPSEDASQPNDTPTGTPTDGPQGDPGSQTGGVEVPGGDVGEGGG